MSRLILDTVDGWFLDFINDFSELLAEYVHEKGMPYSHACAFSVTISDIYRRFKEKEIDQLKKDEYIDFFLSIDE